MHAPAATLPSALTYDLVRFLKLPLVEDDLRATLSFADVAFQCLRLRECNPKRGGVFARPKQQNIDAAIGLAGIEVAWEWAACVARRLLRFFPRNHSSFEVGDDAVGNGLVNARPAGCIAMVAICHDVSRSCTARVGRDCEGGLFRLWLSTKFLLLSAPASCLCGGQRRGGFGQGRAHSARLWSVSEHP